MLSDSHQSSKESRKDLLRLLECYNKNYCQVLFLPPPPIPKEVGRLCFHFSLSVHRVGGGGTPWSQVSSLISGPWSFLEVVPPGLWRQVSSLVSGPGQYRGTPTPHHRAGYGTGGASLAITDEDFLVFRFTLETCCTWLLSTFFNFKGTRCRVATTQGKQGI